MHNQSQHNGEKKRDINAKVSKRRKNAHTRCTTSTDPYRYTEYKSFKMIKAVIKAMLTVLRQNLSSAYRIPSLVSISGRYSKAITTNEPKKKMKRRELKTESSSYFEVVFS